MAHSPASAGRHWMVGLALVLLVGGAIRLPGLSEPLLEGAAGKQTHTAMAARNFYRGHATLARPRVDDVGKPGYFVKELPVLPALGAAAYGALGRVDERVLRGMGLLAWLGATLLLAGLLRESLGDRGALLAGLWFQISPMGIVYSRAAMNDSLAVLAALGALAAISAWRQSPGSRRVLISGLLVGLAFLLKPHTALWLGPAAAVTVLASGGPADAGRPGAGRILGICLTAAAALGLASLWYMHAAAIHRIHPVPGATVAEGWVAPELLARPELYLEIGRQTLSMVFTPLGALVAAFGIAYGPRLRLVEWALVAWGGGVLLQGLVFAPRMFDELSRGTEYYQLPLVPCAAWLIGRGLDQLARRAWARPAVALGGAALLLAGGAALEASRAARPPARYDSLISDCTAVRAVTEPGDELLVLADRGGTVLYYCDRKGQTFTIASAVNPTIADRSEKASAYDISTALRGARYVYVPFPQLLGDDPELLRGLASEWREVPLHGSEARLFARPGMPRHAGESR